MHQENEEAFRILPSSVAADWEWLKEMEAGISDLTLEKISKDRFLKDFWSRYGWAVIEDRWPLIRFYVQTKLRFRFSWKNGEDKKFLDCLRDCGAAYRESQRSDQTLEFNELYKLWQKFIEREDFVDA